MAGFHNLGELLERGRVKSGATVQKMFKSAEGWTLAYSKGAPTASAAGYAKGCLFIDTNAAAVYYNSGTSSSATWSNALAGSALTLEQVFANGKTIAAAVSGATSLQVGNTTHKLLVWGESNVVNLTTNAGNFTIAPHGATTAVTGALTVSTTATVTGNLTVGSSAAVFTATTGALACGAVTSTGAFTSSLNTATNAIVINSNKFLVAADTGNVTIAGSATVGTTLGVTGALTGGVATFTGLVTCSGGLSAGTIKMDALAPVSASATITLNGDGTGGVNIGNVSTGNISLSSNTVAAANKTLTLTGNNGSQIFTMTAGDAVFSAGSLAVTDDDNDNSFAVVNNVLTTATMASLTSTSMTSGKMLSLTGAASTSGTFIYVTKGAAGSFTGKYIDLHNGADSDFSVELHGKTTLKGTATGTDVMVLTKGDLLMSDGALKMTKGNATLTAGDLTIAAGVAAITGKASASALTVTPAADGAGLDLNLPGTANLAAGYIDVDASTGSGPIMEVAFSGAYTGDALSLIMTNAVGAKAVDITGAGVRTASLVHITDTPVETSTIDLDVTGGHSNSRAIDIDEAGTSTNDVISVDFAGAFAGDALNITMTNAASTAQAIVVDGTLAPQAAVVALGATGVPNANGRILEATSSGNASAANAGIVGRFLETGAAQATSYAVQIDSTANEALNVSTGKAHFAESVSVLASPVFAVGANYVTAGGVNNAITVALKDDADTDVPLAAGLRLLVNTAALTLQAGANTLDFNGGGAVSIVSHNNKAANIGVAYVAGSIVDLVYDGAAWQDMSQ